MIIKDERKNFIKFSYLFDLRFMMTNVYFFNERYNNELDDEYNILDIPARKENVPNTEFVKPPILIPNAVVPDFIVRFKLNDYKSIKIGRAHV